MMTRTPTPREYRQFRRLCSDPVRLIEQKLLIAEEYAEQCKLMLAAAGVSIRHGEISSSDLRTTQQWHNNAQAEVARLTALLEDPLVTAPRPADVLDSELNQLFHLPGVYGVRIRYDRLVVRAHLRIAYQNRYYDRGAWIMTMAPTEPLDENLHLKILRTGLNEGWSFGRYPDYSFDGYGNFCFGQRSSKLRELIATSQLLAATSLIIDTMQSVNEEDRRNIPKAFKEMQPA